MGFRMTSRGWIVAGFVACITLGASLGTGCREVPKVTTGELPPPTSSVLSSNQFDDIPVPRGFVLETEPIRSLSFTGSYVYQTPEHREGRLLYTGKDDPAKILDFYRSQMVLPVNGWRHVALRVDSIEAAKAELEGRGVKFTEEIKPAGGGGRVLFFQDPEGNLLHLVERSAESPVH